MLSRLVAAGAAVSVADLGDFFPSPSSPAGEVTGAASLLPGKSPRPPEHLRLASVTVLMRHGSRTPLHLVPGRLALGHRWPVSNCYTLAETDTLQLDLYDPDGPARDARPALLLPHRLYLAGGAQPGALTRLGQAEMLRLGRRLRRDYLDSGLLDLPGGLAGGWLHCRSTSILRCVQSLRCVLVGLLSADDPAAPGGGHGDAAGLETGKTKPLPVRPVVRVAVRTLTAENLFPNRHFVPEAAQLNLANSGSLLGRLDGYVTSRRQLADALGVTAYGEAEHQFVPLYFARDDLASRAADGARLSAPLAEVYRRMHWLCAMELLTEVMGPAELWDQALPFSIGTWVHELAVNVAKLQRLGSQDYHRLALYASHDSMLMPMLLALGFDPRSDIEWPPFGSAIVFEFYHYRRGGDHDAREVWCRVLYNDRAVLLPGCQGEFAPLSALAGCLLRHARPPGGFMAASRAAGRQLNAWYRERGLCYLEPWPYD